MASSAAAIHHSVYLSTNASPGTVNVCICYDAIRTPPDTLRTVRELLEGRGVDFLFVDGDHTYEGVRKDWESYGELVRPGGLVALHDVAKNYDDTEVKRFWDEVKGRFQHREYLAHPSGFYGIGSLYK